jgi:hypothetical protein
LAPHELLAPLPGRRRVVGEVRWLCSLHSLHHRLPAFGPPGRLRCSFPLDRVRRMKMMRMTLEPSSSVHQPSRLPRLEPAQSIRRLDRSAARSQRALPTRTRRPPGSRRRSTRSQGC